MQLPIFATLLLETSGIGEKSVVPLLQAVAEGLETPSTILERSSDALQEEFGLTLSASENLKSGLNSRMERAEAEFRALRRFGADIATFSDSTYPSKFVSRLKSPPPIVTHYGPLPLVRQPGVVLANSNGAPEEALAATDSALVTALDVGLQVVTGHNRPAYQRAALNAIRDGRPVLYVLDRGMLEAFDGDLSRPLFPAAGIWASEFDPSVNLALSPFSPRAHGIAMNNRRRDEIIFALADLVLVGWIAADGQMLRRCKQAIASGKLVIAVGPHTDTLKELEDAGALRIERPSAETFRSLLPGNREE